MRYFEDFAEGQVYDLGEARVSEQEIVDLDIPTGVPRVYNLRADFSVGSRRYLGDPAEIERRAAEVKSQAKL